MGIKMHPALIKQSRRSIIQNTALSAQPFQERGAHTFKTT